MGQKIDFENMPHFRNLIEKGKTVQFLTYEEINNALPSELEDPRHLEMIIGMFERFGILIVDCENDAKKIISANKLVEKAIENRADTSINEDSPGISTIDPVRLYLREAASAKLLDRENEVSLAKKIEMWEMDILYSLVEVPIAVEFFAHIGDDLLNKRIKLVDVVRILEGDDEEDEMDQFQKVIALLNEIKLLLNKNHKIYFHLDDCSGQAKWHVKIIDFKNEIVNRLRAIRLEKTLVERAIGVVEDYLGQMRNCERDLMAYLSGTGKSLEEMLDMFSRIDQKTITPKDAARELCIRVDDLFLFKEMLCGKIEIIRHLEKNVIIMPSSLRRCYGASRMRITWPSEPERNS